MDDISETQCSQKGEIQPPIHITKEGFCLFRSFFSVEWSNPITDRLMIQCPPLPPEMTCMQQTLRELDREGDWLLLRQISPIISSRSRKISSRRGGGRVSANDV